MGFVEDWNDAIENDSNWQFEDLLEDNPQETLHQWHNMRVAILVSKRLDIPVEIVIDFMLKGKSKGI